jgi:hypothetical protein
MLALPPTMHLNKSLGLIALSACFGSRPHTPPRWSKRQTQTRFVPLDLASGIGPPGLPSCRASLQTGIQPKKTWHR